MLTKEQIHKRWNNYTDFNRIEFIKLKIDLFPPFKINVDNDQVYLTFNDEVDLDEPMILDFDEFGHRLIPTLFQAMGIKADFV
jgi:hypothetical protein